MKLINQTTGEKPVIMAKKSNTAAESIVAGGVAPARSRKHSPAKHAVSVSEGSTSTEYTSTATIADTDPVVTGSYSTQGPAFEAIARLAYSYWEARGGEGGSPEEDWLRAEQELRQGLTSSARA
jgi:Protein of unknown function (DUF2934)